MPPQFVPPKAASGITKAINANAVRNLPFDNTQDFADANRGFIGDIPGRMIPREGPDATGPAIDLNDYKFIDSNPLTPAPDTIHPSLWRQAQLNGIAGLFKVCEGIYQVRGYDIANMTIIETDTGLVLIDPLLVVETARAALALYHAHFPAKTTVHAILITHSHADHFGGIRGVLPVLPNGQPDGNVQIIAPEGFLHHAVSENVFAGNAMSRRAHYMYGEFLHKSAQGQVDVGLGKALAQGIHSFLSPNDMVSTTGETRCIDGVKFEFQMANSTEAPCEMLIYIPKHRALCGAEVMTHNMHNLYTLRGAEIRDAVQWWKTIHETIKLFLYRTDVLFAQHHWPIWEQQNVGPFLAKQRDMYKFLHDQTLRLMNHGMGSVDIANTIELPETLANEWYNRGYYGTTSHNVRGIYQRYLGFYSSNPADLDPLPPVEAAKKYVDFMGGSDLITQRAQECYRKGAYRWVATVLNHVVQADPSHKAARELLADAFEQLGYQSEAATWRNEYLSAASELRNGMPDMQDKDHEMNMAAAMTLEMLFDNLGIRLNGPKAKGADFSIDFRFEGPLADGDPHRVVASVQNSCLVYNMIQGVKAEAFKEDYGRSDALVHVARMVFIGLFFGSVTIEQAIAEGEMTIDGDQQVVEQLMSSLDVFEPMFPLVTPNVNFAKGGHIRSAFRALS
ncbi:beta-lactamase domain protein [Linnemannia elongata AG-77]|uniref:Beta-lactamase domain protein n=1 Tax=Linnemannia elongata AG-77 TaxID=1314771 RepID=A0A197JC17_9FUNG|nr:beta-lactamase domain protein [Linnemannia elongata AG-77]